MNIQNNHSLCFGSTFLSYKSKLPLKNVCKELSSFELKGFGCNKSVADIRKNLEASQAGISFTKNGMRIVGIDREADEFIAKQIYPIAGINAAYIEDTPKTIFKGQTFHLSI